MTTETNTHKFHTKQRGSYVCFKVMSVTAQPPRAISVARCQSHLGAVLRFSVHSACIRYIRTFQERAGTSTPSVSP